MRRERGVRVAGGALMLLLLAGRAAGGAIDPTEALVALGFPADTRARVEAGELVEVALPTSSDRDLNVGLTFLVATGSPAVVARTVREEKRVLRADDTVIAWGDVAGDGTTADFEGLTVTPAQLRAFRHAAAGTELNLARDEIAALRAAGDDARAIERTFHRLLLARHRAYRAKGLAGIASYARARSTTSPSADLAAVNRGARATRMLPAQLYDVLERYPDARPPELAESFYWVQFRAQGKDTVALEHVLEATFGETTVLVQRQFYVSTGYDAEQAIAAFLPIATGTLVVYTNHTATDQVAGFGGAAKRTLGRTVMTRQLQKVFTATRAGLGSSSPR